MYTEKTLTGSFITSAYNPIIIGSLIITPTDNTLYFRLDYDGDDNNTGAATIKWCEDGGSLGIPDNMSKNTTDKYFYYTITTLTHDTVYDYEINVADATDSVEGTTPISGETSTAFNGIEPTTQDVIVNGDTSISVIAEYNGDNDVDATCKAYYKKSVDEDYVDYIDLNNVDIDNAFYGDIESLEPDTIYDIKFVYNDVYLIYGTYEFEYTDNTTTFTGIEYDSVDYVLITDNTIRFNVYYNGDTDDDATLSITSIFRNSDEQYIDDYSAYITKYSDLNVFDVYITDLDEGEIYQIVLDFADETAVYNDSFILDTETTFKKISVGTAIGIPLDNSIQVVVPFEGDDNDNFIAYAIRRVNGVYSDSHFMIKSNNNLVYDFTGLNKDTTYYFRVYITDSDGVIGFNEQFISSTTTTNNAVINSLTIENITDTTADVSVLISYDTDDNSTGQIRYKEVGGVFSEYDDMIKTDNTFSYQLTLLDDGVEYEVECLITDDYVDGVNSISDTFTTTHTSIDLGTAEVKNIKPNSALFILPYIGDTTNIASCLLKYKKTSDPSYTEVIMNKNTTEFYKELSTLEYNTEYEFIFDVSSIYSINGVDEQNIILTIKYDFLNVNIDDIILTVDYDNSTVNIKSYIDYDDNNNSTCKLNYQVSNSNKSVLGDLSDDIPLTHQGTYFEVELPLLDFINNLYYNLIFTYTDTDGINKEFDTFELIIEKLTIVNKFLRKKPIIDYKIEDVISGKYNTIIFNYKIKVYDYEENFIGYLDNVVDGSITNNNLAAIKRIMNLQIIKDSLDRYDIVDARNNGIGYIDYFYHRLQPVLLIQKPNGEWFDEIPFGMFLMNTPNRNYNNGRIEYTLECFDKNLILEQWISDDAIFYLSGSSYLGTIRSIFNTTIGTDKYHIINDDATFTPSMANNQEFDIGTSYLEVINTFLKNINYNTLYVDKDGTYKSEQFIQHSNRTDFITYSKDEFDILLNEFSEEIDMTRVYNYWIGVYSKADSDPIVYTLENKDPSNPLSTNTPDLELGIKGIGRKIPKKIDIPDDITETFAYSYLKKQADMQDSLYGKIKFKTIINPQHGYNNVVKLTTDKFNFIINDELNDDKYYEIEWKIPLSNKDFVMEHTCIKIKDNVYEEGML